MSAVFDLVLLEPSILSFYFELYFCLPSKLCGRELNGFIFPSFQSAIGWKRPELIVLDTIHLYVDVVRPTNLTIESGIIVDLDAPKLYELVNLHLGKIQLEFKSLLPQLYHMKYECLLDFR